jgi:DNA-binding NarL/FixJ family response regulator
MTICVIDDHPIMREAIALVLRRLRPDLPVVELKRLRELEPLKISAKRLSVIFLDLNLPDATGWSGVFQVKTSFPTVPLAVYSASPSLEMERSCLEAGANLYVEKTAGMKSLSSALDSLLSERCVVEASHGGSIRAPSPRNIVTHHDHL